MDFKDTLEDMNVEEVKAPVEPGITGLQKRWRQQVLFLFFIIYSGFVPLRKVGRWGACPAKGSLGSGSLSAPAYTALGQAISIFGASASHSLCKALTRGLRSCRGQDLLLVASSQAVTGASLMAATAPGKQWGEEGMSREEDGVRDHQASQIATCFVCVLWLVERTLVWTGCIFCFQSCP